MSTFNLMNSVKVRGLQLFAGDRIDDVVESTADITAAGGVLVATGNTAIDAAALKCRTQRQYKAINEAECDAIMSAAFQGSSGSIRKGTGTLAAGTLAVSDPGFTASTRLVITMKDPGAGAITGFAGFETPVASRVAGTGFTVNAIDDAKALIATAVCTFDWVAFG